MDDTHLKEPRPRLPPHLPLLPADLAQPHRLHVTLPADDGAAHVEAGGRVRQARQVAEQGRGRARGEVRAVVAASAEHEMLPVAAAAVSRPSSSVLSRDWFDGELEAALGAVECGRLASQFQLSAFQMYLTRSVM